MLPIFVFWISTAVPFSTTVIPCQKPQAGMVCVPGGFYWMGSDLYLSHPSEKKRVETPKHKVFLSTFYVDSMEVTNKDYMECMEAGHCKPPSYWARPGGNFYKNFRSPKRPFVRATWMMAKSYCEFRGKRLLTEAEWEAAARGKKGNEYPWGNQKPSCAYANYRIFPKGISYPKSSTMKFCAPPQSKKSFLRIHQDQTWPVGSTPAFHGIYDMAGNGFEWVADHFDPHIYGICDKIEKGICIRYNPKGPCNHQEKTCKVQRSFRWVWKKQSQKGKILWKRQILRLKNPKTFVFSQHILKGGSWWWDEEYLRSAYRRSSPPNTKNHRLSIRCGASVSLPLAKSPKKGAQAKFLRWKKWLENRRIK